MGVTIDTILISYDVSEKKSEVKSALEVLGYRDCWKYSGIVKKYPLPDTTLWHESKSSIQGLADLKSVCASLRVTLEKAVAVKASEYIGI